MSGTAAVYVAVAAAVREQVKRERLLFAVSEADDPDARIHYRVAETLAELASRLEPLEGTDV